MFRDASSCGMVGDVRGAILWRACSRGRLKYVSWHLWVHVQTNPGRAGVSVGLSARRRAC